MTKVRLGVLMGVIIGKLGPTLPSDAQAGQPLFQRDYQLEVALHEMDGVEKALVPGIALELRVPEALDGQMSLLHCHLNYCQAQ